MDQHQFDAALRALQAGTTRRAGLAGALGVLLGGAVETGSAAGKRPAERGDGPPHGEGPCGDGSPRANRCTKDSQCCTGMCNTKNRRCRCVQRGNACRTSKNCCNTMTCSKGVCKTDRPACTAATCPNGCCSGTTCVTATSASACGTGGAACSACSGATPVCDSGSCRALAWSSSAKFGTSGTGDSNFNGPAGVFVSSDSLTAWVADMNNNRISIWTRPNTSSTTWSFSTQFGTSGTGDSNFNGPAGVFVSSDSLTAWAADAGNNRIAIWTRPDTSSTTWSSSAQFGTSGSGNDNFTIPRGVFVSADALTAWIADTGNSRIAIWTRPNTASTTWSSSAQFGSQGTGNDNFSSPFGVSVSADSLTAWIADMNNNRISIWTRPNTSSTTWSYSTQFGTSGSGNDNFTNPAGVFVSSDTLTAWVADAGNNRIAIWTRPDTASTTWSYTAQFGTQGAGNDNFNGPIGVFVAADSLTAWVADADNNRIAIWTAS
jgi:DNA-binding beta-propeller fold protein YncE